MKITRRQHVTFPEGQETGATLLEYAIVIPILMAFMVGMIDLCRVMLTQSLLQAGAEEGATLAATMSNIDIDIRNLPPTNPKYQFYAEARRRVLAKAVELPLGTGLITNFDVPSPIRLLRVQIDDALLDTGGQPAPRFDYGAGLLRPGDRLFLPEKNQWLDHVRFPLPPSGPPVQPPLTLLKYFPVEIVLTAEVDIFLPGVPNYLVTVRASGLRENFIPSTPLPISSELNLPPIVEPTPSPSPTPVPFTGPTPVPDESERLWNNAFNSPTADAFCPNSVGVNVPCSTLPLPSDF